MKRRWARLGLLVAILAPLLVVARVAYRGARDWLVTLAPPREVAERSAVSSIEPLVDVAFVDPHRRTIRGWFHPGTNGATVVLLHGFGANRAQLAPEMRMLAGDGYGFLAYDAPGHGESDGTNTWGDTEQDTLRAAVDFVSQQTNVDPKRLGALGFSLGGAVLALTAPTEPRIRAVVLEATFSTLYEDIRGDSGPWGFVAAKPSQWALERRGELRRGVRPEGALRGPRRGARALRRARRPHVPEADTRLFWLPSPQPLTRQRTPETTISSSSLGRSGSSLSATA